MRRTADMKWSPGPEEHELLSEKASAVRHFGSHLLLGVIKDVRIMRKVTRASFCYLGESNGQGKVNDATRADIQNKKRWALVQTVYVVPGDNDLHEL